MRRQNRITKCFMEKPIEMCNQYSIVPKVKRFDKVLESVGPKDCEVPLTEAVNVKMQPVF